MRRPKNTAVFISVALGAVLCSWCIFYTVILDLRNRKLWDARDHTYSQIGILASDIWATYGRVKNEWPESLSAVNQYNSAFGSNLTDLWSVEYRYASSSNLCAISSAGPDMKHETSDDIVRVFRKPKTLGVSPEWH
jgi:hypothetical protein